MRVIRLESISNHLLPYRVVRKRQFFERFLRSAFFVSARFLSAFCYVSRKGHLLCTPEHN